jgi:hypothetical protein
MARKGCGSDQRNEQVESMLFNLVHCWRLGESVDVLMRNAELLLQPEASHWNGEPSRSVSAPMMSCIV